VFRRRGTVNAKRASAVSGGDGRARAARRKESTMPRRLPVLAAAATLACAAGFAALPAHAAIHLERLVLPPGGFAVSAGQPWGGYVVAAPVVRPVVTPWAPVVTPAPVVVPRPVYVVRPVVRPVRWRHARPVVVVPPAFVPAPVVVRPW